MPFDIINQLKQQNILIGNEKKKIEEKKFEKKKTEEKKIEEKKIEEKKIEEKKKLFKFSKEVEFLIEKSYFNLNEILKYKLIKNIELQNDIKKLIEMKESTLLEEKNIKEHLKTLLDFKNKSNKKLEINLSDKNLIL